MSCQVYFASIEDKVYGNSDAGMKMEDDTRLDKNLTKHSILNCCEYTSHRAMALTKADYTAIELLRRQMSVATKKWKDENLATHY